MSALLLFTIVAADRVDYDSFDCERAAPSDIRDEIIKRLGAFASFADATWSGSAIAVEDAVASSSSTTTHSWASWIQLISPASAMSRIQLITTDVQSQPLSLLATSGPDPHWGELSLREELVGFEVLTQSSIRARILSLASCAGRVGSS